MRAAYLLAGASLALTSVWAVAQDAPESLLPKMFEDPAPAPAPTPTPRPQPGPGSAAGTPRSVSSPVVQALPGGTGTDAEARQESDSRLSRIPSLEELARMTPEDFEELLGSKVQFDMPPAARRSMERVGLITASEGGLPEGSLAGQNPRLVELALSSNRGTLVSRWGHILLRRALISRLQAPAGMEPQQFATLRIGLLLRMGEIDAARAVLQDIDIDNYTPTLADLAMRTYERTSDFTGLCPVLATHGSLRDDPQWDVAKAICEAFRGNSSSALSTLERDRRRGTMTNVDLLLAQKYAGAAGKTRRAVTIEWDKVKDMTPWRYGLALGVGLEPPARLMTGAGAQYAYTTALAPMVSLQDRAAATDRAGAAGILSNAAMVDLYGQIYADTGITGEWQDRAESLRDAYTLESPAARLAAMQALWNAAPGSEAAYSRRVLTAAAAARMPATDELADSAASLISSMLSAGYDANAARWSSVVEDGSLAWGLLAVGSPGRTRSVDTGDLDRFIDDDESANKRKAAFLVAGLAGLGRIDENDASRFSNDLSLNLGGTTRWTTAIDSAAERGDKASVALLAGFGMQGTNWQRMTPRYLFHIVSALRRVGFDAEARMIAAEAVSRA
ncbi:hypothetical protein GCM10011494_20910 [Novosphingobium endophyticum]|uniref:Lytic transglycosylase domain-containing protein n=1 Tax=Novosphingobium endophyticum TaxID=1955250 RepID=A0A916TSV9_9SPHN|nr:hypothetical protein [Novosphingobium endophyticum]GGC02183.1 hypothetical protein GCM10011494_20910 [Novosphingobium endophyticum]